MTVENPHFPPFISFPLFSIYLCLSLFFWSDTQSTSRCRQLATRGLGCDHKRINSSDRTCRICRRGLAERPRMADESRRGASTREQCRGVHPPLLFFFGSPTSRTRPSKKNVHEDCIAFQYRGVSKGRSIVHREWMRFCHSFLLLPLVKGIFSTWLFNFINRNQNVRNIKENLLQFSAYSYIGQ